MNSYSREDLIINIVLDVFLEVSQIDPCYISPDCELRKEVGLNDEAIELIFNHSIRKANLVFPKKPFPASDTLREIVAVLLELDAKNIQNAA